MRYVFVILACIALISCRMNVMKGEGAKGADDPSVPSFSAVDIHVPLRAVINVEAGSRPSVRLSGYENVLKHIETKVKDGVLLIRSDLDDTWILDCDDVTAQITMPLISGLTLRGAPNADIHGDVTGPRFALDISGAAGVVIDKVDVDDFSAGVSGAANIEVKGGTVRTATYEISGAGKIKAYSLQAGEASATISGAGTSEVTAMQKLSASISGAGSVSYKGHPSVTKEVSGVGTVNDAN